MSKPKPSLPYQRGDDDDALNLSDDDDDDEAFSELPFHRRKEARMAERLSVRLLAVPDDDEEEQDRILRQSLMQAVQSVPLPDDDDDDDPHHHRRSLLDGLEDDLDEEERQSLRELRRQEEQGARRRIWTMTILSIGGLGVVLLALWLGVKVVGPPSLPIGPYQLVERQEGDDFFSYYEFYEGRDSAGSNGYNMYVGREAATALGIVNVSMESDELDVYNFQNMRRERQRRLLEAEQQRNGTIVADDDDDNNDPPVAIDASTKKEPFLYMLSAPTENGPRDSIRLEGIRRFNRGLFM